MRKLFEEMLLEDSPSATATMAANTVALRMAACKCNAVQPFFHNTLVRVRRLRLRFFRLKSEL